MEEDDKELIIKKLLSPYEYKRVVICMGEFSKKSKGFYIFKLDEKIKKKIIVAIFNTPLRLITKAEYIKEQLDKIDIVKYFEMKKMFNFNREHKLDILRGHYYGDEKSEINESEDILTEYQLYGLNLILDNFNMNEFMNYQIPKDLGAIHIKLKLNIRYDIPNNKIHIVNNKYTSEDEYVEFAMNDHHIRIFSECNIFKKIKLLYYYCDKFGIKDELINTIEKLLISGEAWSYRIVEQLTPGEYR